MSKFLFANISIFLAALLCSASGYRAEPGAPIPGEPDLEAVTDERLVAFYVSTVHERRALWEIEDEAARTAAVREFLDTPLPEAEVQYAVQAAHAALDQSTPDWNVYRVAMHATRFGEAGDARFVELARKVFEMPRSGKVSEFETRAIYDTFRILDQSLAPEAADLLWEATRREFWGSEKFTSRMLGETQERVLTHLRANVLGTLTRIPPEHSLPVLEALKEEYPDTTPYEALAHEFIFELGAGPMVDHALRRVYQRAGLDPDGRPEPEEETP